MIMILTYYGVTIAPLYSKNSDMQLQPNQFRAKTNKFYPNYQYDAYTQYP